MRDEQRGRAGTPSRNFDPHGGNYLPGYPPRDLDRGRWEEVPFLKTGLGRFVVAVNLAFLAALLWALLR